MIQIPNMTLWDLTKSSKMAAAGGADFEENHPTGQTRWRQPTRPRPKTEPEAWMFPAWHTDERQCYSWYGIAPRLNVIYDNLTGFKITSSALWGRYLTKRTGEPVQVAPLVVLPGWFVKITERGNFPVWAMNANYLPRHLVSQREQIEPAQVRRIILAIDDKCRDVEF